MFDNDYHILREEYWRWIDRSYCRKLTTDYLPLFASLYLGSIEI